MNKISKKRISTTHAHPISSKFVGPAGFPHPYIQDCLNRGDKVLIIHRHGESTGSKQKNPHDNYKETLFAKNAVEQLSEVLTPHKESMKKVFSSPFPRTIETAKTYAQEIILRCNLAEMAMSDNPGWDFSKLTTQEIVACLQPYQDVMPSISVDEIAGQVVHLYNSTAMDTDWRAPLDESPGRTRMAEELRQIARETEPGTLSTVSIHGFAVTPQFVSTCFQGDEFKMPLVANPEPDPPHTQFGPDYCGAVIVKITPSGTSEVLGFWRPQVTEDELGV